MFQNIDRDYEKFDFEWIFIDDGSTDKSVELIEKFSNNKKRIRFVKNPGKGKIDAINYGFKISEGKFIKLVGGDDEIDLNFIKKFDHSDENISFVHDANIINEENNQLGTYTPSYQLFDYDLDKYFLIILVVQVGAGYFQGKLQVIFFQFHQLNMKICIYHFV